MTREEISEAIAKQDAAFDAWKATIETTVWARFDLSAAKLGFEAGQASAGDRAEQAEAESKRLRDALEPFLPLADALLAEVPAGAEYYVVFDGKGQSVMIMLEDQHRARRALTDKEQPHE